MMGMGGGGEGETPAPPPPPSNEIVDITDKIAKPECFVLNQVGGWGRWIGRLIGLVQGGMTRLEGRQAVAPAAMS